MSLSLLSQKLRPALVCPACRVVLTPGTSGQALDCPACRQAYPIVAGQVRFVSLATPATGDAAVQQEEMHAASFRARLSGFGRKVVSSDYTPVNQLREFMAGIGPDRVVVELGSGSRRLTPAVINVDLFPFPHVDLVADIARTPFPDGFADCVIIDTVLEHVPEPTAVVNELYRILKPGGQAICIAPFIFPYHGYPAHYFNYTKDGLAHLFRNFSACDITMNIGPTAALTHLVSEYFALAFSGRSRSAYVFFKGLFLLPIFFFKFLDALWRHSPHAVRLSSTLCAIVTK